MRIDARCVECLIKREASFAYRIEDTDKALSYMKDVLAKFLKVGADVTAPHMTAMFTKIYENYTGVRDAYIEEKRISNDFMLQRLDRLRGTVAASDDGLVTAMKLAVIGNYIDFGALQGQVSMGELDELLDPAPEKELCTDEYDNLLEEMKEKVREADMIIAKGQGSFETLSGSGLNVYYLLMCKCSRFTEIFSVPALTGILADERWLPDERIY